MLLATLSIPINLNLSFVSGHVHYFVFVIFGLLLFLVSYATSALFSPALFCGERAFAILPREGHIHSGRARNIFIHNLHKDTDVI